MLIVETGSGISNANSYVALLDARNLADSLGFSLPADDTQAESALAAACRYLETFRPQYQGHAANGADQSLSFPRNLVFVNETEIDNSSVPVLLQYAQVAAASEITNGTDLLAAQDGRFEKASKVDVIESEYSESILGTPDGLPRYPNVDVYLRPLLREVERASRLRGF